MELGASAPTDQSRKRGLREVEGLGLHLAAGEMVKVPGPAFKHKPPGPTAGYSSPSVLLVRLGELSFSGLPKRILSSSPANVGRW